LIVSYCRLSSINVKQNSENYSMLVDWCRTERCWVQRSALEMEKKTINKLTDARVSYSTLSSLFFHAVHGMCKEKAIKCLSSS